MIEQQQQQQSEVVSAERRSSAWRTSCLLTCWCLLAACGQSEQPTAAAPQLEDPFTKVKIPDLKLFPGDVIAPLPEGSPAPSSNPRDLEGLWMTIGAPVMSEATAPFLPAMKAELKRREEKEKGGTPVVDRGTLCRPPGNVAVIGNQFPTQILQRPGKILVIAEENRGIWPIYMDAEHPKNLKPSFTGHNVGRWEGNTLVIDSVGFNGKPGSSWGGRGAMGLTYSTELHVITRITRARIGDDQANGARLVIEQTIDDPKLYERPWISTIVARWRPDAEMLEFNCEESPPELISDGLIVE